MSKNFREYFSSENRELPEAFLDGYVAALKRNKIYDPALFLEGYQLQLHVLADLITQEKRAEDAVRSQERIISKKFESYTKTKGAHAYIQQLAQLERGTTDEKPLELNSKIIAETIAGLPKDLRPDIIDDLIMETIASLPEDLEKMPPLKLPSGKTKDVAEIVYDGIRKYIEMTT